MQNWMRPLGSTGLAVSAVCLGGGPLAHSPGPRGIGADTPSERAVATVLAALDSPIRFIDTSNAYGEGGESEQRIGEAIRRAGGLPADFVLETKVDAKGVDFSGARVRRSLEESLERLGLDSVPMLHLHDPEYFDFGYMTAKGGAVEALVALREQGVVRSIGLAGGNVHEMARYLALEVFDVLLTWGRWTLVDRSAGGIIAEARRQRMGVLNGAVYAGGLLARRGMTSSPNVYEGRDAPVPVIEAVTKMHAICDRYQTDLATAAQGW